MSGKVFSVSRWSGFRDPLFLFPGGRAPDGEGGTGCRPEGRKRPGRGRGRLEAQVRGSKESLQETTTRADRPW